MAWLRIAKVTIADATGLGKAFDGLRVSFDVEHSRTGKEANKGKATIYNLSTSSTQWVESQGKTLVIEAGYEDQLSGVIFVGEIKRVTTTMEGPDRKTEIQGKDGGRAIQTRIAMTLDPGTTVGAALSMVAARLGLEVIAMPFTDRPLVQGLTIYGPASTALENLATQAGMTWWIEGGTLMLSAVDEPTTEIGLLVSPETGLVGSPSRKFDEKTDRDIGQVEWSQLIDPRLRPGLKVQLVSRDITGWYVVDKVAFSGDLNGDFRAKVLGLAL